MKKRQIIFHENKIERRKFNPQIIKLVQKRFKIPEIFNWGKIKSIKKIIPIFIKRVKMPKVNILKGKVTNFKIGFKKKLINPKINPAKIKICQEPANSSPLRNLIAK